jgi:hypothetical protein
MVSIGMQHNASIDLTGLNLTRLVRRQAVFTSWVFACRAQDKIVWVYEMAAIERITVTLPANLVRDIDRREKDRSRFVAEAVLRELARRRRAELRQSLENPHLETVRFSDQGLAEWFHSLPAEDVEALVDSSAGTPVRWMPGAGWLEEQE